MYVYRYSEKPERLYEIISGSFMHLRYYLLDITYRLVCNVSMKKSEHTRDFIIETAAPVFNKHGYEGTSLADVLEYTGLTKGAIYHYFENKDELALAALEYNLNMVTKFVFSAINRKTGSCDKLSVFAETFRNNYDSMRKIGGCPLMNAAIDSDDGNVLIKNRVNRSIDFWQNTLKTIIENGKSDNEISPSVDAEGLSMNLFSLIEGGLALSKVRDEKRFLDHAVELVLTLVEGIKVK